MNKDDLEKILRELDEDATILLDTVPHKCRVVIIGGAAIMLRDLSAKTVTYDIDVLEADGRIRDILAREPNLNFNCNAYCDCLPYNFEDRLCELQLETKTLAFYTPSQEDLAVMKLYRWNRIDQQDLKNNEFLSKLDWDLLDHLIFSPHEAMASRISQPDSDRQYKDLLAHYNSYQEYRKI